MKNLNKKEISANGVEGHIVCSGGNMTFLTQNKEYLVTTHDFDVKIIDDTAILNSFNKNSKFYKDCLSINKKLINRIDYSQKLFYPKNTKPKKLEIKAKGIVGIMYDNEPWIFLSAEKIKGKLTEAYEIWHQTLKIRIIDSHAAFYEFDDKPYAKYWDGILDYSSESQAIK